MRGFLDRRLVHAGQSVFRQGELGNKMYVIERGSVEIWRGTADDRVMIAIIPSGGVFGEMAIFDGKPRMASATALEETVLVQVDGTHLRDALQKADPIIDTLVRVVLESARDLGRQLHKAQLQNATLERELAMRKGPADRAPSADET